MAPLLHCHGLSLRWEKPAAVVVKALTNQPDAYWRNHELPLTATPGPATLSGLTLTGVKLSPEFDPNTTMYTASVSYATSETTVRPVPADDSYAITLFGNPPSLVQLATGINAVTITVTSADGNTANTYSITVSRGTPSTDASLVSLTLGVTSPDQWTPIFESDVLDYDVRVPHSTARISVLAATADDGATFVVGTDPAGALSGSGATLVELAEGATTTVTVTAEDGTTTRDCMARIHCAGP